MKIKKNKMLVRSGRSKVSAKVFTMIAGAGIIGTIIGVNTPAIEQHIKKENKDEQKLAMMQGLQNGNFASQNNELSIPLLQNSQIQASILNSNISGTNADSSSPIAGLNNSFTMNYQNTITPQMNNIPNMSTLWGYYNNSFRLSAGDSYDSYVSPTTSPNIIYSLKNELYANNMQTTLNLNNLNLKTFNATNWDTNPTVPTTSYAPNSGNVLYTDDGQGESAQWSSQNSASSWADANILNPYTNTYGSYTAYNFINQSDNTQLFIGNINFSGNWNYVMPYGQINLVPYNLIAPVSTNFGLFQMNNFNTNQMQSQNNNSSGNITFQTAGPYLGGGHFATQLYNSYPNPLQITGGGSTFNAQMSVQNVTFSNTNFMNGVNVNPLFQWNQGTNAQGQPNGTISLGFNTKLISAFYEMKIMQNIYNNLMGLINNQQSYGSLFQTINSNIGSNWSGPAGGNALAIITAMANRIQAGTISWSVLMNGLSILFNAPAQSGSSNQGWNLANFESSLKTNTNNNLTQAAVNEALNNPNGVTSWNEPNYFSASLGSFGPSDINALQKIENDNNQQVASWVNILNKFTNIPNGILSIPMNLWNYYYDIYMPAVLKNNVVGNLSGQVAASLNTAGGGTINSNGGIDNYTLYDAATGTFNSIQINTPNQSENFVPQVGISGVQLQTAANALFSSSQNTFVASDINLEQNILLKNSDDANGEFVVNKNGGITYFYNGIKNSINNKNTYDLTQTGFNHSAASFLGISQALNKEYLDSESELSAEQYAAILNNPSDTVAELNQLEVFANSPLVQLYSTTALETNEAGTTLASTNVSKLSANGNNTPVSYFNQVQGMTNALVNNSITSSLSGVGKTTSYLISYNGDTPNDFANIASQNQSSPKVNITNGNLSGIYVKVWGLGANAPQNIPGFTLVNTIKNEGLPAFANQYIYALNINITNIGLNPQNGASSAISNLVDNKVKVYNTNINSIMNNANIQQIISEFDGTNAYDNSLTNLGNLLSYKVVNGVVQYYLNLNYAKTYSGSWYSAWATTNNINYSFNSSSYLKQILAKFQTLDGSVQNGIAGQLLNGQSIPKSMQDQSGNVIWGNVLSINLNSLFNIVVPTWSGSSVVLNNKILPTNQNIIREANESNSTFAAALAAAGIEFNFGSELEWNQIQEVQISDANVKTGSAQINIIYTNGLVLSGANVGKITRTNQLINLNNQSENENSYESNFASLNNIAQSVLNSYKKPKITWASSLTNPDPYFTIPNVNDLPKGIEINIVPNSSNSDLTGNFGYTINVSLGESRVSVSTTNVEMWSLNALQQEANIAASNGNVINPNKSLIAKTFPTEVTQSNLTNYFTNTGLPQLPLSSNTHYVYTLTSDSADPTDGTVGFSVSVVLNNNKNGNTISSIPPQNITLSGFETMSDLMKRLNDADLSAKMPIWASTIPSEPLGNYTTYISGLPELPSSTYYSVQVYNPKAWLNKISYYNNQTGTLDVNISIQSGTYTSKTRRLALSGFASLNSMQTNVNEALKTMRIPASTWASSLNTNSIQNANSNSLITLFNAQFPTLAEELNNSGATLSFNITNKANDSNGSIGFNAVVSYNQKAAPSFKLAHPIPAIVNEIASVAATPVTLVTLATKDMKWTINNKILAENQSITNSEIVDGNINTAVSESSFATLLAQAGISITNSAFLNGLSSVVLSNANFDNGTATITFNWVKSMNVAPTIVEAQGGFWNKTPVTISALSNYLPTNATINSQNFGDLGAFGLGQMQMNDSLRENLKNIIISDANVNTGIATISFNFDAKLSNQSIVLENQGGFASLNNIKNIINANPAELIVGDNASNINAPNINTNTLGQYLPNTTLDLNSDLNALPKITNLSASYTILNSSNITGIVNFEIVLSANGVSVASKTFSLKGFISLEAIAKMLEKLANTPGGLSFENSDKSPIFASQITNANLMNYLTPFLDHPISNNVIINFKVGKVNNLTGVVNFSIQSLITESNLLTFNGNSIVNSIIASDIHNNKTVKNMPMFAKIADNVTPSQNTNSSGLNFELKGFNNISGTSVQTINHGTEAKNQIINASEFMETNAQGQQTFNQVAFVAALADAGIVINSPYLSEIKNVSINNANKYNGTADVVVNWGSNVGNQSQKLGQVNGFIKVFNPHLLWPLVFAIIPILFILGFIIIKKYRKSSQSSLSTNYDNDKKRNKKEKLLNKYRTAEDKKAAKKAGVSAKVTTMASKADQEQVYSNGLKMNSHIKNDSEDSHININDKKI